MMAKGELNENFRSWFKDSKVVDASGNPLVVYHGTNAKFKSFDTRNTPGGVTWFSSDREMIERGESGAVGSSIIMPVYLSIQNPAGWKEYENLMLDQVIQQGFDGFILDDNYVVFNPTQIKSVENKGTWNASKKNIFESFLESMRVHNPVLIEAILDGHRILSENRYPSIHNNLGELISDTPDGLDEFWNWFGDSQVIDADGRPIVATHSTNTDFNEFDMDKASPTAIWGKGIYLSLDKKWTGLKFTKRYYVKCTDLLHLGEELDKSTLDKLSNYVGRSVDAVPLIALEKRGGGSVINGAVNAGFDGIVHMGPGTSGTHLVILNANQLRLINTESNNRGNL
jgi:hypothetical protein